MHSVTVLLGAGGVKEMCACVCCAFVFVYITSEEGLPDSTVDTPGQGIGRREGSFHFYFMYL